MLPVSCLALCTRYLRVYEYNKLVLDTLVWGYGFLLRGVAFRGKFKPRHYARARCVTNCKFSHPPSEVLIPQTTRTGSAGSTPFGNLRRDRSSPEGKILLCRLHFLRLSPGPYIQRLIVMGRRFSDIIHPLFNKYPPSVLMMEEKSHLNAA